MHVIQSIGPLLGIAAFLGLAILAFLLFQQSRDIRRLREWAGRAPERAQEAADAVQAASEAARGDAAEEEPAKEHKQGVWQRLGAIWARAAGRVGGWFRSVDRRLPVDGRYLVAVAVVAIAVVAVATSGFGLVGGQANDHHPKHAAAKPKVAVLNGTSVTGLADLVDKKVVKAAGYKTGMVTNAGSSFANTVVMYLPGGRADAKELAGAIKRKLGDTPVQAMTADVKSRAGGAPLALALGLDDAGFGSA
jgi:LytR cell envelope-related transcriptional attenuator